MDATAKADEFHQLPAAKHLKSYTGLWEEGSWHVMCSSMEVLPKRKRLPHDPAFFQGFHYVRLAEKTAFEGAFRKRRITIPN
ncbi:MAG TPA: hypothetical protein VER76_17500 [Pyrinomonadaceae bacterium]|nr:hypothetical protein [Pyrinomonadaceae bacterium]